MYCIHTRFAQLGASGPLRDNRVLNDYKCYKFII